MRAMIPENFSARRCCLTDCELEDRLRDHETSDQDLVGLHRPGKILNRVVGRCMLGKGRGLGAGLGTSAVALRGREGYSKRFSNTIDVRW
jgi:hypothetical protein